MHKCQDLEMTLVEVAYDLQVYINKYIPDSGSTFIHTKTHTHTHITYHVTVHYPR